MGYIAPVNNYQYQQYAERVNMKDYDPYQLTPVYRVQPYRRANRDFEDQLERQMNRSEQSEEMTRRKELPLYHSAPIPPHLIPKYTGKGQHFNESI
ncbi:hypothetical protein [Jeotgalibacillus aurantiacus]|uniref:hypothetical protein n=1 Tax=Jeotgalibacillus aurantiacus TaxID=2763266 RepID=UPI001D0BE272|nr:hypothetical protein [Jeotgalibacillus aurantiacus]